MSASHASVIAALLESPEPSIRWKVRANVLGDDVRSRAMRALREEVRVSPRVRALLARRDARGRITAERGVYDKWQGAHWILASLADLGYPEGSRLAAAGPRPGARRLARPRVLPGVRGHRQGRCLQEPGVPVIRGRPRRCASQQGNALYYLIVLGLADDRVHDLAERLLHWQWPDGGWNCDKKPAADTSTFIPRLTAHARPCAVRPTAQEAQATGRAARASEIFLVAPPVQASIERRADHQGGVHRSSTTRSTGTTTSSSACAAWRRPGLLDDPRCADALDLLEQKRLPDGGWPAESRYYKTSARSRLGNDYVDWGGTS